MKNKMTSLILAACLLSSMLTMPSAAAFTDISDSKTAVAAAVLESMGIANGLTATTYGPNTNLTRAQFSALAVRAMGLEDSAGTHAYKTLFTDVKPGSWYTGYVNLAYSKGIINGYGNGNFGPEDSVTYGQVATILLRLLGYTADEVGKVWPADYVNFAKELDLDEGVSLDAGSIVTRGDAAKLIYSTVKTEVNGSTKPYYETISGVYSTEKVIALDNSASSAGASGYLMACRIGTSEASIEYYPQKKTVSGDLMGFLGTLLLNSAGKAIGFVPDGSDYSVLTIKSAKASGITDTTGKLHRITGSAAVIYNGSLYAYGSTGYLQADSQAGKTARLYYNSDGAVSYVYISSGISSSTTEAVVSETSSAASELARRLGISSSGYAITKNGSPASSQDIAKYDVAYYDPAAKTMCVSDYRVEGYIESAYPTVGAAETITVSGCTLEVLECAWATLENEKPGAWVTLLLTDDGKVAAAYPSGKVSAEMLGLLSADGGSVKLCGSGLVLTANTVSASDNLRGTLVKVSPSKNSLTCSAFSAASYSGRVDIAANTLGSYKIAPGCSIYEWAGDKSYVCSLSGVQGESSSDFSEVKWTTSLSASEVSYYRLNSAGQVDILLLKDVTGNSYTYGNLKTYSGENGIIVNTGSSTPSYNDAASITNSKYPKGSSKYFCSLYNVSYGYWGIALGTYSGSYQRVAATSKLTAIANAGANSFFLDGDDWYFSSGNYDLPVSDEVEVCISSLDKWQGGQDGLLTAISSGMNMTVYYDRTLTTGARVRLITLWD